jgi:hypothetical protein
MTKMTCKPHIAFIACEACDTDRLEQGLKDLDISFAKGEGCYQGTKEPSYLCILSTDLRLAEKRLEQVCQLAGEFEQESVLYCDNERTAYLLFMDKPDAPRLGTLVEVAVPQGDYSYFQGRYYEVQ